MNLEGDVRVGLRGDSAELKAWEKMTDKEKEAMLAETKETSK